MRSGRWDSNPRPPAPKAGALPSCATPRGWEGGARTHDNSVNSRALCQTELLPNVLALTLKPAIPAGTSIPSPQWASGRGAAPVRPAPALFHRGACRTDIWGAASMGELVQDQRVNVRAALVGLAGFEPASSSSRTRRATKLRHSPRELSRALHRPSRPSAVTAPRYGGVHMRLAVCVCGDILAAAGRLPCSQSDAGSRRMRLVRPGTRPEGHPSRHCLSSSNRRGRSFAAPC